MTRLVSIAVVILIGACGRLSDDTDATADAADATADTSISCSLGIFAASPLSTLNSNLDERNIRFTANEHLGAFSVSNGTKWGVRLTARADRALPPGPPAGAFPDGLAYYKAAPPYPSLVNDAALLFLQYGIYADGCTNGTVVWNVCEYPHVDSGYDDMFNWSPAYGSQELIDDNRDGLVTSTGDAYYFAGDVAIDGGLTDFPDAAIHRAIVYAPQDGLGSTGTLHYGATLKKVAEQPASTLDDPVPSFDELTLFISMLDPNGIKHIHVASRASTSELFGSFASVPELDTAEGEYPNWLSPDGCRLYFTRTVGGQTDLFVANRAH